MRDDDHRFAAFIDLQKQIHDLDFEFRVDICRRLVRNDNAWVIGKRTRKGNPLLFAPSGNFYIYR